MTQLTLEINLSPSESIPEEHQQEAQNKAKEAYIMTLLKHHHVSMGKAAQLLNINRWQLSELMSIYNLSPFPEQTEEELITEVNETLFILQNSQLMQQINDSLTTHTQNKNLNH